MGIAGAVDQLDIDADAFAGPLHCAFEDHRDAELFGDFGNLLCRAGVAEHGRSRDDPERGNLRELRQEIVMHTLGEKRVFFARAPVVERQHGDRGAARGARGFDRRRFTGGCVRRGPAVCARLRLLG